MSPIHCPAIGDDLLDLLAEGADSRRVVAFRLPHE